MVYKVKEETIDGIANAIRTKTGSTEEILVQDFAAEILNIETGENTVAAAQSAKNAEASAISAASSAQAARDVAAEVASNASAAVASASAAQTSAFSAKSSSDSAKTYADKAAASEATVKDIVENVEGFNSEAWAVGTRNGIAVSEGDTTYQNNAKHWAHAAAHSLELMQIKAEEIENNFATANVFVEAVVE